MCIKKFVGVLRAISGTPHPKNFTSTIIAAAGLSERFGGSVTKQMTERDSASLAEKLGDALVSVYRVL